MTDLRTAAQQALEAMEDHAKQYPHMQKGYTVDAITALKVALEKPERAQRMRDAGYIRRPTLREMAEEEQPEQEPYCYVYEYDSAFGLHREFYPGPYNGKQKPDRTVPVYTHPPRREWRELTDQEVWDAVQHGVVGSIGLPSKAIAVARAIEAKLKELNHE